jgi:hypothetical protein
VNCDLPACERSQLCCLGEYIWDEAALLVAAKISESRLIQRRLTPELRRIQQLLPNCYEEMLVFAGRLTHGSVNMAGVLNPASFADWRSLSH